MHLLEDLGLLAADLEPHLEPQLAEFRRDVLERLAALREIDDHHHVEVVLDDRLGNVENVDLRLGEIRARLGQDPDRILADNSNNGLFH